VSRIGHALASRDHSVMMLVGREDHSCIGLLSPDNMLRVLEYGSTSALAQAADSPGTRGVVQGEPSPSSTASVIRVLDTGRPRFQMLTMACYSLFSHAATMAAVRSFAPDMVLFDSRMLCGVFMAEELRVPAAAWVPVLRPPLEQLLYRLPEPVTQLATYQTGLPRNIRDPFSLALNIRARWRLSWSQYRLHRALDLHVATALNLTRCSAGVLASLRRVQLVLVQGDALVSLLPHNLPHHVQVVGWMGQGEQARLAGQGRGWSTSGQQRQGQQQGRGGGVAPGSGRSAGVVGVGGGLLGSEVGHTKGAGAADADVETRVAWAAAAAASQSWWQCSNSSSSSSSQVSGSASSSSSSQVSNGSESASSGSRGDGGEGGSRGSRALGPRALQPHPVNPPNTSTTLSSPSASTLPQTAPSSSPPPLTPPVTVAGGAAVSTQAPDAARGSDTRPKHQQLGDGGVGGSKQQQQQARARAALLRRALGPAEETRAQAWTATLTALHPAPTGAAHGVATATAGAAAAAAAVVASPLHNPLLQPGAGASRADAGGRAQPTSPLSSAGSPSSPSTTTAGRGPQQQQLAKDTSPPTPTPHPPATPLLLVDLAVCSAAQGPTTVAAGQACHALLAALAALQPLPVLLRRPGAGPSPLSPEPHFSRYNSTTYTATPAHPPAAPHAGSGGSGGSPVGSSGRGSSSGNDSSGSGRSSGGGGGGGGSAPGLRPLARGVREGVAVDAVLHELGACNVVLLDSWPLESLLSLPGVLGLVTSPSSATFLAAAYWGVPLLAWPMQGDELDSARRAQDLGMGFTLPAKRWRSAHQVLASLVKLVSDEGLRQQASKAAALLRADAVPPAQRAADHLELALARSHASLSLASAPLAGADMRGGQATSLLAGCVTLVTLALIASRLISTWPTHIIPGPPASSSSSSGMTPAQWHGGSGRVAGWPASSSYQAALGLDKGDDACGWECRGGSQGYAQRGPSPPNLSMTGLAGTSSGHTPQVQGQSQAAGVGGWGLDGKPCFTHSPDLGEVSCSHDGSAARHHSWGQQLPPPSMESCILGLLALPGPGSPRRITAHGLMQHKKTLSWNCGSRGQATGRDRPSGLDRDEARPNQQHLGHDNDGESAAGQRSERCVDREMPEGSEGGARAVPRIKRGLGSASPMAATTNGNNSKTRFASVLISRARFGLESEPGTASAEHMSGRSNCVRASSLPVT
ncbi:hypothetical protein QJQ45_019062, partial [Haematococcus lacustris]